MEARGAIDYDGAMKTNLLARTLTRGLFVSCLVWLASGAQVWADDAAGARPEWIWTVRQREPGQTAYLRQVVRVEQPVTGAQLTATTDFAQIEVLLNGHAVLTLEPFDGWQTLDVSRWLVPGPNVLAVIGRGGAGPAAVALQLEIRHPEDHRTVLRTDGRWLGTNTEQDGWLNADLPARPPWTEAASFGPVDETYWPQTTSRGVQIHEVDDYTQWKQALGSDPTGDPATFLVPPGFELQLIRAAEADEGSWISLEFDPQGRLLVSREDRGLLRMTLKEGARIGRVEVVDDTLLEIRGLLYAHGALYANANNSKALYRLRDTDGDDQFDEIQQLYASAGGVGHGRNDLALGPDGKIYSIHGDSVDLPRGVRDFTSPFREQPRGANTREGHLLRFDPDGRQVELVAAGLRNPYGIGFHADGDAFTYDADAEFDMGSPWYRPTRVNQLVSGSDFGWRGVTGTWPSYYPDHPDNAPPTCDIGKGSPTAVMFGYQSRFPAPYREALYILDWAYGRIITVQLEPRGAGYAARAETFVRGRPLNVTDLDFGTDGAMYFITGGRKTRSALYRVRYVGEAVAAVEATPQQAARRAQAAAARGIRRQLEALHQRQPPASAAAAIEQAWPHLNSADPVLRHAARIVVEHQPATHWRAQALGEARPLAAVTALLALARDPDEGDVAAILNRLNALPWSELTTTARLAALHAYELCLARLDTAEGALRQQVAERLDACYPDPATAVNRQLAAELVRLQVPPVVDKTLRLLRDASDQPLRLHYLYVLRTAVAGWTDESRRYYFTALREMRDYRGGEGMPTFMQRIETDAVAAVPESERPDYAALLAAAPATSDAEPPAETRPFVKTWTLPDLADSLGELGRRRDFARGEALFAAALCVRCHRVGLRGAAIGPDLTSLAGRFSRRDMLESILTPDKVVAEQYRRSQVVTQDGRILTGQILPDRDYRSPTLRIATDPLQPERTTEVAKSEIAEHRQLDVSVMPAGLLNTLSHDEILDLLAWLEAAGDRRHPNYRP